MNRILTVIGLIVFLGSCSTPECNEFEQKIMDICLKEDTTYIITLGSLTEFEWDTLYVIGGPTVDNEAGDIIGLEYKKLVPDDRRQYIFIKDRKIVKEYSSYCIFDLTLPPSYSMGYKYLNTSKIQVIKKKGEGDFIYRLKRVQNWFGLLFCFKSFPKLASCCPCNPKKFSRDPCSIQWQRAASGRLQVV